MRHQPLPISLSVSSAPALIVADSKAATIAAAACFRRGERLHLSGNVFLHALQAFPELPQFCLSLRCSGNVLNQISLVPIPISSHGCGTGTCACLGSTPGVWTGPRPPAQLFVGSLAISCLGK